MNKGGQFYLVAGIIIAIVLISIFITINSSKKYRDHELKNLEEELKTEIEKTFEYNIKNGLTDEQSRTIWINFSGAYVSKIGTNKNTLFIFGDEDELILKGYRMNNSGDFKIDFGSGFQNIISSAGNFQEQFNNTATNITIADDEDEQEFKLEEGQNFYYLISKEISGEKKVIKG
jgi:hypothetical protein